MTEEHRLKIKDANVLSDLIEFFKGRLKLEPLRVHVGLALLKKVLPDLTQTDGTVDHNVNLTAVRLWTREESQRYLTAHGGNSNPSMIEQNDMLSVSVTDEQERH